MNISPFVRQLSARNAAVVLGLLGLGLSSAHAQSVNLSISGGSNTPLVISFTTPITFTIGVTPNTTNNYPHFVFEGLGNLFGSANTLSLTSAPTYSRNGGASNLSLVTLGSGMVGAGGSNPIAANDVWVYGPVLTGNMVIGDTFTLAAGTFITTNYSGVAPASGSYSTFLADTNGLNLGAGSAIPEPSTYAAIAGAAALGLALWHRRRRVPAPSVVVAPVSPCSTPS